MADYIRSTNEAAVADDEVVVDVKCTKPRVAEEAVAEDEVVVQVHSHRTSSEAATATDGTDVLLSLHRKPSEAAVAADDVVVDIHYGKVKIVSAELSTASDSVVVAASFGKVKAEEGTAADAVEIGFKQRPRYIHIHHVSGNPAYVLSAYEDYRGLVGPHHAVTLKQGRSQRVTAKSFETWTLERQRLAYMMERGVVRVHEDYLGTRRELTSEQVDSYVADNAPWATWVLHRTITGAPVAPDAAPPTHSSQGVRCSGFDKVLVRVDLDGGVAPDVDIVVWYRLPTATDRGVWVLSGSALDLANNTEAKFTVHYGEAYVHLTDQDGDPTTALFYLSGCSG